MEIKSAVDLVGENTKIRAGVYGVNGTGKTTFGATFSKPLFLDLDRGLLSVRGREIDYVELYQPPQASNMLPARVAIDWWDLIMRTSSEARDSKDHESLIVDSMTTVCHVCMRAVQANNSRWGMNPNFDDWNAYTDKMKDFSALVLNADKHCLFICHEQAEKDEGTGRLWMLPALPGKGFRAYFPGLFDEFYHSEVELPPGQAAPIYKLLARPSQIYTAKSRLLPMSTKDSYLLPYFDRLIKMKETKK